jgi:hypothetical protein
MKLRDEGHNVEVRRLDPTLLHGMHQANARSNDEIVNTAGACHLGGRRCGAFHKGSP